MAIEIKHNEYLRLVRERFYEATKDRQSFVIQVLVFQDEGVNATSQYGAIAGPYGPDSRSIVFSNRIERTELSWGNDIHEVVELALNKI